MKRPGYRRQLMAAMFLLSLALVAYQVAVNRELLGVMSYSVVTQHAACEMARGRQSSGPNVAKSVNSDEALTRVSAWLGAGVLGSGGS